MKEVCKTCGKEEYCSFTGDCFDCKEKKEIAELSIRAIKEGETNCEDYIVCPYCGEDYGTDDIHKNTDVECNKCNNKFHIEVNYTVDYSTSKIEVKK